jgi:rhamnosyltransferase
VPADFLISSGTLFNLDAIDKVGQMDESLFIDHVDTEWFLRARSLGMRAYGVCDAVMQHGLGEQTHRITLGRQRNVPQHKPFRYYYIFRNSVALYRRGYASALWKWNDLQRLIMIAVMFGAWKSPRWQNLKMMGKGIWHGLRGVTGPLAE